MRFAYIDSQGKEVGIPSVEALQLRIELGAIVESTMFYDANADRWALAEEHEIFRTLQREVAQGDEGGFVAPLPRALGQAAAPETATPEVADEATALAAGEGAATEDEAAATPGTESTTEAEGAATDLDLPDVSFEFIPEGTEEEEPEAEEYAPEVGGTPFDFGDFGALEVEEPEEEAEAAEERVGAAPLTLETPLSEQDFPGGTSVGDDALALERPMSEYTPDQPPAWMEEDEEEPAPALAGGGASSGSDSHMDRTAGTRPSGGGGDQPNRPPPRARPARARKPRRTRSVMPLLGGLVVVGLAAGAVFAWTRMQRADGQDVDGAQRPQRFYTPVEIPTLPTELQPIFREAADSAWLHALSLMRPGTEDGALPVEPPAEWLAGAYLANASRYAEVQTYWRRMKDWLEDVRAREQGLFRGAFEQRMDSLGVAEGDRPALLERALAGFQSALPDRDPTYDGLLDAVDAALGFHGFLLTNEDQIEYAPATGTGTGRDPVLEALPANDDLGDEMWGRVDLITEALQAFDALDDRVTTASLVGLTVDRLAAAAVH